MSNGANPRYEDGLLAIQTDYGTVGHSLMRDDLIDWLASTWEDHEIYAVWYVPAFGTPVAVKTESEPVVFDSDDYARPNVVLSIRDYGIDSPIAEFSYRIDGRV